MRFPPPSEVLCTSSSNASRKRKAPGVQPQIYTAKVPLLSGWQLKYPTDFSDGVPIVQRHKRHRKDDESFVSLFIWLFLILLNGLLHDSRRVYSSLVV